jgi:guanylate kinase
LPMSGSQASKGMIVVISGPSGVGKGTICKKLVKHLDYACLSVSVTTRPRTPKEIDGKDYWFVSKDEFQRRIEKGLLLEHAEVFGNFYGTPKDKVDEAIAAGKVVILEIDVQGGKQIKKLYPDTVMVFILAPTPKELAGRLHGRGRDDEETAQRRLDQASAEVAAAWQDYNHMVINDKLDVAVNEIIGIIETARKTKKK